MIETTIPEINVSELMERVRVKVEEIRKAQARPNLPQLGAVREIATVIMPKPVTPKTEQILRATGAAREATTISRWIPKPLRWLFRRQDKFNREILRAIESLNNTNAKIANRLQHLMACAEVQDHGIQHLADLRRADGEWMNEVVRDRDNEAAWMQGAERLLGSLTDHRRKVLSITNALLHRMDAVEQKSLATAEAMESIAREAQDLKQQLGGLDPLDEESRPLREQISWLKEKIRNVADQLAAAARHNAQLSTQANNVQAEHATLTEVTHRLRIDFDNVGHHVRSLQIQADQVKAVATSLQQKLSGHPEQDMHLVERAAVRHDLESLEQRQTSDSAFIKAELSRQSALVYDLLNRSAGRTPTKSKTRADTQLSEAAERRLDAFYFSFENRFRGPREEIKRRMRFYLPLVENCRAGKRGRPIVDLGCGRGEWLELLKQQKLTATGIDLNAAMIGQCKERGLSVVQADAVAFLRELPNDSHGAITGFHIIEHLPLDTLVSLITETFRVLRPGGLALFESPNCKNLTVGACSFYIDPTHRNPVFPETAQFMLETHGFERVSLEYLCPVETNAISDMDKYPAYLRELLYGARDFGVIGYKPADQPKKRVTRSR